MISGRREAPADWAHDHPDKLQAEKMPNNHIADMLTCTYCAIEIDLVSHGKKPWNQVNKQWQEKGASRKAAESY